MTEDNSGSEKEDELINYGPDKSLPQIKKDSYSILWIISSILSIGLSLYILYYSFSRYNSRGPHTVIALGWGVVLYTLTYHLQNENSGWTKIISRILSVAIVPLTIYITYYFFINYSDIQRRVLSYQSIEYTLGGLLILIALIATRRAFGNFLTFTVVLGLGYGYFGPSLPGWLNHTGVGVERIIEINVLTLSGAYGFIPQVGTTWVAIFLIYAGLLEGYGALNFAFSIGKIVERNIKGGAAQSAVLASLFMGSISGSAAANTAATGAFTIPFMKDRGFKSETAAGIESTASSGGQVVPPVMGAAAFVMAGILNTSYLKIVSIALLPALLFYLALSLSTHLFWLKQASGDKDIELEGQNESTKDSQGIKSGLKQGMPMLLSLIILVYYLAVLRYDPMSSALRAIVIIVITQTAWMFYLSGFDTSALVETTKDTLQGLQIGAAICAPIFVILASIGILEAMLNVGDLTRLLTFAMLDVSGDSLLVLLFLAMLMSLLFGLGMPTVAAYVLVGIFVGPAVVEFGVEQLHAHMFVFYFAILSAITPPVALTCVVACRIADSGFLLTCREALRVAAPVFILPYAFIVHPSLLEVNLTSILTFILIAISILGIATSTVGHLFRKVNYGYRIIAAISGALIMVTSTIILNIVCATVILLIVVLNYPESISNLSSRMTFSK